MQSKKDNVNKTAKGLKSKENTRIYCSLVIGVNYVT